MMINATTTIMMMLFPNKSLQKWLSPVLPWIKWDKSVSKRLDRGQFCLRYFRQVLTHPLLFQPSRRSCFSRYLSKKCQVWDVLEHMSKLAE